MSAPERGCGDEFDALHLAECECKTIDEYCKEEHDTVVPGCEGKLSNILCLCKMFYIM